ncbi:dTDP-4-amino-4,6-dideoxygalactose transaminase [Cellulophaga sp. 20_2_10]|uniref:dTDP-4-amino-4,6-dideoxygalactose transaminase n=1 Tax=Cellulophaga sp. 20_2_10 TaxID=2942476 RepID=UPI00201AF2FC|nr:dTDP-4-amino-4,6-dideoxygalactose transaminase [Cellulophaga sp. 20_2_10]MCL5247325.1 dTDP-4-amino-4,6-dideoxygalactose transaminase [Cellulophaga sp. 20_2_10]
MIPFNKPFLVGKEIRYIEESVKSGKISGNGYFTNKCQKYFEDNFGFKKALLTTSCTDALEMTAMLMNIKPGDEVIVPSYTFVSSALAFVRQGANIVFADSRDDHPGINENGIEALITSKTKAIVVVHYAGVACDMDVVMGIANKYNLFVVEDAAQAIDSYYKGKPLGSIGHFGTFSFHETKNIISGEGGLLAINDGRFVDRAEVIWEKGTNRSSFFKGEVDKYGWVDTGSSFLPSELVAAFLYAQLEHLKEIQQKRESLWNVYYSALKELDNQNILKLASLPNFATNNAHMFYVITKNIKERDALIAHLKGNEIHAVFHYLSLHKSPYYTKNNTLESGQELLQSDRYTDCLIRLPLFYNLKVSEVNMISKVIIDFFK